MTDASQIASFARGKFIVFDGPDGAGKSTQREKLADLLRVEDIDVVCCRDPGGTEIGDRIRSVLLDHDLSKMDATCEALLFMASRAQLMTEVIRPALKSGATVLCDRFVTSTCAYQGAAGFDPKRVIELGHFVLGQDGWPELTLVFDVDTGVGFERIGRKSHHAGKNRQRAAGEAMLIEGSQPDAMEARSAEFHRRVREHFLSVARVYPTPVYVVDGRGTPDEVFHRVLECLTRATG